MSISTGKDLKFVGKSILRKEGIDKVTGRARYVDDVKTPGALYGKTLRSSIACGRIKKISFAPNIPWDQFTIVDARDVPYNRVLQIESDQPVLCDGVVLHREEPILLIAHEDPGLVETAIRSITVEYEREPGIFNIGEGRILKQYDIEEGDWKKEFAAAEVVFEGEYKTGAQEHVYIETNGFIACWEDECLTVHGSMQCPYYVHKALKYAFKLQDDQINVVQMTTGGGFGGKEDFPSVLAIHAALLAKKSGRTVRLIYDRAEDMASSTKRHPSISKVRTACTKDGILRAIDFSFHIDGGAYITLSPVVLSRGIVHAFGPYKWPAAKLHAQCFFTNSPPYGAFRGFGAPQSLFAIEAHMTALANHLGMDPAELRRRNFIHRGDTMPTGQVVDEDPNMEALLDRALELSDYKTKRARWKRGGGKGISLSTFMHGTGFTGSGEVYLASRVGIATTKDGGAEVRVSSTEIGQGTETVFPQIAAEALGIDISKVSFRRPETKVVPNSGPTVASRTCSVVGKLVERAAGKLKQRLAGADIRQHYAQHGEAYEEVEYVPRPGLVWDDDKYKGSAYGAYSWCVNVAEVTVDPVTAMPRVDTLTATVDVGTIINPVLAHGQMEGGIAQGIGWATCENVVLKEGLMENHHLTNYVIPTSADAARIVVEFMPSPYSEGAFGSKGVGELPMDGPGPAIVSALNDAMEAKFTHLPLLPEEMLK
ncbi:xanthine dehydrogenase family protein [Candidatus Sumerlaeota bacterium]|nr:xanthine dehydrogenase family protein [Candidatus Sumerlaeota bacterium]